MEPVPNWRLPQNQTVHDKQPVWMEQPYSFYCELCWIQSLRTIPEIIILLVDIVIASTDHWSLPRLCVLMRKHVWVTCGGNGMGDVQ